MAQKSLESQDQKNTLLPMLTILVILLWYVMKKCFVSTQNVLDICLKYAQKESKFFSKCIQIFSKYIQMFSKCIPLQLFSKCIQMFSKCIQMFSKCIQMFSNCIQRFSKCIQNMVKMHFSLNVYKARHFIWKQRNVSKRPCHHYMPEYTCAKKMINTSRRRKGHFLLG